MAPSRHAMSRWTVWRRNAPQLFFSFVATGMTTVAAQEYFARVDPARKDRWLSATLFAGTLAAIAGVRLGRRWALERRARVGVVIVTGAGIAGIGALASPIAYIAGHALVRGILNLGVQAFDAQANASAGAADRRVNDHASTALRFVGMLAGPLGFGLGLSSGAWSLDAAIVAAALTAVWGSTAPFSAEAPKTAATTRAGGEVPGAARLLYLGGLAIYGANFLLAASMVYIVGDTFHVAAPAAYAGRLMAMVYGSTVVTSLLIAGRGIRVRPAWTLISGVTTLAAALAVGSEASRSPWVQGAAAAVIGASFALLLLALREVASTAPDEARDELLVRFNNLGNVASLAAFALMIALVELGRAIHLPFTAVITRGMAALGSAGLVLLCAALVLARRSARA